jgi:hypothetical protein
MDIERALAQRHRDALDRGECEDVR